MTRFLMSTSKIYKFEVASSKICLGGMVDSGRKINNIYYLGFGSQIKMN